MWEAIHCSLPFLPPGHAAPACSQWPCSTQLYLLSDYFCWASSSSRATQPAKSLSEPWIVFHSSGKMADVLSLWAGTVDFNLCRKEEKQAFSFGVAKPAILLCGLAEIGFLYKDEALASVPLQILRTAMSLGLSTGKCNPKRTKVLLHTPIHFSGLCRTTNYKRRGLIL